VKKEKSVGFIKRYGFNCEIAGIGQACLLRKCWEHNCRSIAIDVAFVSYIDSCLWRQLAMKERFTGTMTFGWVVFSCVLSSMLWT